MFASSIWAKYSKTILHSRPRAGRTRSSMLSSTSLHVRNRSRGLSTPRQARQAQPARGDAAHTLGPRDHLANSQSQTRPDVRPIIRDSALLAALMRIALFRTAHKIAHSSANGPCQRVAQVYRFRVWSMPPPSQPDKTCIITTFVQEYQSWAASALVCTTWLRLIQRTAATSQQLYHWSSRRLAPGPTTR